MTRANRLHVAVLAAISLLLRADRTAMGAGPRPPAFAKVVVAPFVVQPQPFPGALERPEGGELERRLAEEAASRAARSLVRQRIASVAERVPSREAAAEGTVVVTDPVRLPLALPPDVRGLRAAFRPGIFAIAEVTMRRADGTFLAREQATLKWDEVRWTRGGKVRRARPLDDVLQDAVRKVVDRAVKRLKRHDLESLARRSAPIWRASR